MNAAIYARYSSSEQAGTSTLESQIRACKEYALKHGHRIAGTWSDKGVAGSRDQARPEFQAMIAEAQKKAHPFDVILVWKYSRFFRDREKSAVYKGLLKRHGVEVISVTEQVDKGTPSGRLLEGIIEVVDEFYSSNLAQETRRGLKENVLAGYRGGSVAPFGYRRKTVKAGDKPKTVIVPDPRTAPTLKKIFRDSAAGAGVKRIAKTLNERGTPAPRGGTWDPSTIRSILRNEVYLGWGVRRKTRKVLRPNDKWSKVELPRGQWIVNKTAHKPLIDAKTWEVVDKRFGGSCPNRNPHTRASYLLTGFLKCAQCGGNFVTQRTKMKSGEWFPYYLCGIRHRRGNAACSNAFTIPHEPFNERVIETIIDQVTDEDRIAETTALVNVEIETLQDTAGEDIDRINRELYAVGRKLDRCVEAITAGHLARVAAEMARLEKQEAALKAELAKCETAGEREQLQATTAHVQEWIDGIVDEFQKPTVAERRQALEKYVDSIIVDSGDNIEIRFKPEALLPHMDAVQYGECAARGFTHVATFDQFTNPDDGVIIGVWVDE